MNGLSRATYCYAYVHQSPGSNQPVPLTFFTICRLLFRPLESRCNEEGLAEGKANEAQAREDNSEDGSLQRFNQRQEQGIAALL